MIAAQAEKSAEFLKLPISRVSVVRERRYRTLLGNPPNDYSQRWLVNDLGSGDPAGGNLRGFLRRSGFYHDIAEEKDIDIESTIERFRTAPRAGATSLVLIHNIECEGEPIDLPDCRIWKPDTAELAEWFETRTTESFQEELRPEDVMVTKSRIKRLEGSTFLERQHHDIDDYWDAERLYMPEEAQPWLTYLQLVSLDDPPKVGTVFVKWNSPFVFPPLVVEEGQFVICGSRVSSHNTDPLRVGNGTRC